MTIVVLGRLVLSSVLKPATTLDLSYKRIRVWMGFKTRPSNPEPPLYRSVLRSRSII
jgi:hypothetical protein